MDIYDITASALTAQRLRMDTIASNLANVNSTRKEDGSVGAYRRKAVVFAPLMETASESSNKPQAPIASSIGKGDEVPMRPASNGLSIGPDGRPLLKATIREGVSKGVGVEVVAIEEDTKTPMRRIYDPSHPDADAKGYVELPNINPVTEMVDMIAATRAYEANVTALQSGKSMMQAAMEL